MSRRWKSIVGTVVAVAVAATPALVGATTASASANTSERAAKHETTISIRTHDRRIEAGESSKVQGNLNIKKSDAEPGQLVSLEAKADGETGFTAIGTTVAGAKGGIKLAVTPAVTTVYRWYYAGSDDARAARSGVAKILVGPKAGDGSHRLQTTLSIRATDRPADADGDSLVRGKLVARGIEIPHREILLLSRTAGNPFAVVAMARTDRDGVVRFPVSPTAKTAYRLKFEGTRLLRPSRSGVVRVGVRPVITASAAPTPINPGETSTVSGVATYEGAPLVGATVDLVGRHAKRKHARFAVLATGTTDALGAVSFEQAPTRTTVYRLVVRHTEGTPPRAVSDNVRVVVRKATSLSIRGRTTPNGYAVSGVLRGGGGTIPQQVVALQVLGEDGVTWTEVDSARTKKHGKVQFLEPISEGASYRLAYAGGRRLAPSVSGIVVN
jgi:hypothetical protein